MEKLFSVSRAAKLAGMTAEALRHYDRIGLVKPCRVDEWTGYRYYSQQEIVRLNTVKALRCMDLTLEEIKEILSYDDFGKIVEALRRAEAGADEKIAELNSARERIRRARMYYEGKAGGEAQAAGRSIIHSSDALCPVAGNISCSAIVPQSRHITLRYPSYMQVAGEICSTYSCSHFWELLQPEKGASATATTKKEIAVMKNFLILHPLFLFQKYHNML